MNYIDAYPELLELEFWFKTNGYSVNRVEEDEYTFVQISGNNIKGGFCTYNTDTHPFINYRFAADHVDCFNKWSQCPLVVSIPCDFSKLKEWLDFLGTPEGYKVSNSFTYLESDIFPREIE